MSKELKIRRNPPETARPKRLNRKTMIVGVLISGDPGGMTAEEIAIALYERGSIPTPDTIYIKPRLSELKAAGEVIIVGKRKSSRSNWKSAIWKVNKH